MKIVEKMMADFETRFGKPATQMIVGAPLYDALKRELKAHLPSDMEIDYIKLHGVLIQRQQLH